MEIVFELLMNLLGFLLELVFEFFAQAVFEVLGELGMRCLAEPFKRPEPANPMMAVVGYMIYGAFAGALSLLLPQMFTVSKLLRITNLIVTPVACGLAMSWLGRFRERRGDERVRLDTFMYGYLFALSMAVVRFIWR